MRRQAHIMPCAALAAALSIAGCAATPKDEPQPLWDHEAIERETFTINGPQLVLGTPHRAVPYGVPYAQVADDPWWLSRNDARLNVRHPDADRGEITVYTIHIDDRQRFHSGRIRDTHRRTLRSTRAGYLIR